MKPILKSSKLANVAYDIRGPVLDKARQMEDEGHKIIKLNIGNVAAFGLEPPDEIVQDMIRNLPHSAGYTDSKGLFAPRKAVVHYTQEKRIHGVGVDDVYLGNGASELIQMAVSALVNDGDEILIPTPDFPLYTAVVGLSGGRPVHYMCDEGAGWLPDIDDIRRKISPRTRGIIVCNPNNPTGALYPEAVLPEIIELARQHQLMVLSDEIYDKTLYDGHTHTSMAALADDVLFVTFNGLSKNYRSWLPRRLDGGQRREAPCARHIEGLNMLPLAAPVQQHAQAAGDPDRAGRLPEHQGPGGAGRAAVPTARPAFDLLTQIPGVSVVKPKAALYMFPRLDPKLPDRRRPAVRLRAAGRGKVLIVQGTGFNWPDNDHFRLVFLPNSDDLHDAVGRIERFLAITANAIHSERHPTHRSACSASAPSAAAPTRCSSATRRRSAAAPPRHQITMVADHGTRARAPWSTRR